MRFYTQKRADIVNIPSVYHLVISYAQGDISCAQDDITFTLYCYRPCMLVNFIRYTLLYIDRGVYMGKYTPRAPEGYILKNEPTCKDGGLLLNMAQTSKWNDQMSHYQSEKQTRYWKFDVSNLLH